jgi:hypothetical protein
MQGATMNASLAFIVGLSQQTMQRPAVRKALTMDGSTKQPLMNAD